MVSASPNIRDAVFNAAAQARLGPLKEPAGLLPGSDDRPADILLPYWSKGTDTALDITVVNPLQVGLVVRVSQEGDHAVEHAHQAKMRKYHDRCEQEGLNFSPMAVDTLGGWHSSALDVLIKLGRQLARVVGKKEGDTVRQLRQRLAVLLVRDNMTMLHSRTPSFPPPHIDGDVDSDEI